MTREEAIEIVKTQYSHDSVMKTALGMLIPELRESENERMAEMAIKAVRSPQAKSCIKSWGVDPDDVIAWIEKQKDAFENGRQFGIMQEQARQELEWPDEKQKEQKPAWSEDYREEDIQTRFAFYTYKDDPCVLYLSNVFVEEASRNHGFGTRILKAAEKAAEAIGAIKICLRVKQDSPANAWYRKHGYGYVAFEDGYDWLEKNLEYLKPTQPAELEQGDKKMLDSAIRIITQFDDLAHEPTFAGPKWTHPYTKELAWLKSLRPSCKTNEQDKEMKLKILKYLSTRCSVEQFEEVEEWLNNKLK